jgi:FkbM family methyltransferase
VLHLQPDIALDVGTNYGECLFGLRYPPQTHAIGIEANPALMPLVLRTLSTHPDRDRIRVIHGLVSDTSGSQAVLHIDPGFSGTASAVARAEGRLTDERNVSTVTIDDLIEAHESHAGCSSIVIKMDIEGFEGVAMRGFHRLNTFEQALGVVEFDLEYLTNAPVDGQALLDMLLQRGVVMDSARGPRELRRVEGLPELQALHTSNGGGIHTDLVFVSSLDVLPPGWIVRRGR